ncbi:Helix-hairpin-helix motif [Bacteroidales bacterium Barb6XT]|nr:Helix-hairpin-helix motif [Bacteroidales bacterium Barb6XT]OAV67927.1 Helix-hairpin-helix motif [Bacteroidales bacterium Barb6XT]
MKLLPATAILIIMPAVQDDLQCQVSSSPPDKWMEYVQELSQEAEDAERAEALYADLSYLSEHPFELNQVTAGELKRLPFLSDEHIEGLLSYRQRFGPFLTLYELKNIRALDFQAINLLLPFVYIGELPSDNIPLTLANLSRYGKNELQLRYDQCLQQKKGYATGKYLGEPFYHSLHYSYAFDDRLQAGFTGEKDAGEPLLNKHSKGYDYYSACLFLKDISHLKSLAVGDYKLSFGQGLIASHDFTPGRNSLVTQAERRTNGFRRHFSANEADYFRGAAATLKYGQMEYSLFYSFRHMDAAVDSNNTFASFQTDGLHRTEREREKRHTVPVQTAGGNIRYASPDLCIGLTALSYSFGNRLMQPALKPYNRFYFRGSNNTNIGIDYLIKRRGIKFYGETAVSRNAAVATLNALQLTPASYLSFLLLHRSYDRHYQALYGNAFSQNSTVQNEQGIYTGFQIVPFARWKLSAYADLFRFPWLKYGTDAPSSGKEYMVQADYAHNSNTTAYVRYKYKQKEKNGQAKGSPTASILPYAQQRIRLQFSYGVQPSLSFRTSVDGILYKEETQKAAKGFALAQSIGWKPTSLPVQADIYAAWFHTDDYNSRISSCEKHILYSFYTPSFYGKGIRLSAVVRWHITKHLSLSAKIACTRYADRETTGTDLEEISGSEKTDIYTMLRWKF